MQIGIDVERQHPLLDFEQIVARFFTAREYCELARVDASLKEAAFFQCWTRKEALAKATRASDRHLASQYHADTRRVPVRLISFDGDAEETERWTLLSLELADGFHAALAICASSVNIQCLAVPALHAAREEMAVNDLVGQPF